MSTGRWFIIDIKRRYSTFTIDHAGYSKLNCFLALNLTEKAVSWLQKQRPPQWRHSLP